MPQLSEHTQPVIDLEAADPAARAVPARRGGPMMPRVLDWSSRYGVLVVFLLMCAMFALLRPNTFPNWNNIKSLLQASAPLAVVGCGLTVVFVMREFDLSFAALAGLAAALATTLMANHGVDWHLAILVALLAGVGAGVVNGVAIAYFGAPSFVVTLALGTVFTGIEFTLTNQQNVFQNIAAGYVQLGQGTTLGVNNQVLVALVVFIAVFVLLDLSERGRYMHAIGASSEAAHLSGVNVRRLRLLGFIVVGVCGAIAGILISAQAASSSPNMGAPLLLPAFAAVFLGSAAFKPGQFNVRGTLLGVLFLGVVQNGLTLLNATPAVINLVQGALLLGAVLVTVLDRRRQ